MDVADWHRRPRLRAGCPWGSGGPPRWGGAASFLSSRTQSTTPAAIASGSGRPKAPPATRPAVLFSIPAQTASTSSRLRCVSDQRPGPRRCGGSQMTPARALPTPVICWCAARCRSPCTRAIQGNWRCAPDSAERGRTRIVAGRSAVSPATDRVVNSAWTASESCWASAWAGSRITSCGASSTRRRMTKGAFGCGSCSTSAIVTGTRVGGLPAGEG
jgi:hypothetical protein